MEKFSRDPLFCLWGSTSHSFFPVLEHSSTSGHESWWTCQDMRRLRRFLQSWHWRRISLRRSWRLCLLRKAHGESTKLCKSGSTDVQWRANLPSTSLCHEVNDDYRYINRVVRTKLFKTKTAEKLFTCTHTSKTTEWSGDHFHGKGSGRVDEPSRTLCEIYWHEISASLV